MAALRISMQKSQVFSEVAFTNLPSQDFLCRYVVAQGAAV